MAEKVIITKQENIDVTQKAGNFWDKYSRLIMLIGTLIILSIAGWYGYNEFIKKPKEKKASEMIFAAESLFDKMASSTGFNKDTSIFVLNGNKEMGLTGILKVIKDYSGTRAGNRAEYIAGATYLHLKDFPKAIRYLEDFDAGGAYQVQSKAYIMLGHAYAEQNKTKEALEHYKKAASVNTKDDGISADALFLAASYADATGKKQEAIDLYNKIKKDYPGYTSVKSGDIDKFLAKLGILK